METKIYGYIYKITNLINNKIYIGQTTSNPPRKRFNSHKHNAKSKKCKSYISNSIKKYGYQNFKFEVIDKAISQTELNFLEATYINLYNTLDPKIGYNLTFVDINGNQRKSEQTKQKMKNIKSQPEYKKLASETGKKRRGKSYNNSSNNYVGVYKIKENKYRACIRIHNKLKHIGVYTTEIEAAKARDIQELNYMGNKAILNFPELKEKYLNNEIQINKRKRGDFSPSFKKSSTNITNLYYSNAKKRWIYRNRKNKIQKSFKTKEEAESFISNLS